MADNLDLFIYGQQSATLLRHQRRLSKQPQLLSSNTTQAPYFKSQIMRARQWLARGKKVNARREREISKQFLPFREVKEKSEFTLPSFEKGKRNLKTIYLILREGKGSWIPFPQFREEKDKSDKIFSTFEKRKRNSNFLILIFLRKSQLENLRIGEYLSWRTLEWENPKTSQLENQRKYQLENQRKYKLEYRRTAQLENQRRTGGHLGWRTGEHIHVTHVLQTYSTFSHPRWQDGTNSAAL